ncbi:recombinase RecJ [Bacillus coahuilensis m2-6]|uniref:single-stranded-DNA-specific exonuclease RecJ n=1 Tax=Bacillus coahuilensis TaxID=408580 RepID=UPI0007504586|nr:single-stranded-DNA-specific exonuclease RecJ [Bacillus coahuilensis]KUP07300.1 recombinase RecJ [Bacillus coahuilensis m2-6]
MLHSKSRWLVKEAPEQIVQTLQQELSVSSIIAKLLYNRGIKDSDTARSFLWSEKQEFHDPFLLKGMDIATDRIKRSIELGEAILVFGDYDADGVTSTSVLLSTLRDLGAEADFYIPNRFNEGYGPNENAFRWAYEMGYSLIITVDTGIAAIHEAAVAKELGLDLIITDHHEPGPELPDALAIIHPKLPNSNYPFHELAGVGVAFKVAHALYGHVPEHLLDLVTIGTIADLVPLFGENRSLVKRGLKKLQSTNRPGLQALCKVAGTTVDKLNEEGVGFTIGPRLNAIGRLSDADPAVDLLLTDDMEEAIAIAEEIDQMNKERKNIVSTITEEAIEMVETQFQLEDHSVLVLAKEGWNPGVVGIVASRLVDRFYRPTIVLGIDSEKGIAKGSARSIVGFDLFQNLSTMRELLPHFGGHPMAAGMTLNIEDVNELRARLNTLAKETLTEEDFVPLTEVDTHVTLDEVSLKSIEELDLLSPYGMGNPKPKFVIDNVHIGNMKKIGGNGNHLKLNVIHNGTSLDGIGFHLGELTEQLSPVSQISLMGELAINEWNSMKKPQLFIKDIKVNDWQLFDVRGLKQDKWVHDALNKEALFISFGEDVSEKVGLSSIEKNVVITNELDVKAIEEKYTTVVFLTIPTKENLIRDVLNHLKPERVYAHFYTDGTDYFSTMPTRDHFKWYYGFLSKRGQFDLMKHGGQLAAHKGWTKDTIDFMSQVFFELNFVTIEDGLLSLNPDKLKKDLSDSRSYRQKQALFKLEQELVYSSITELKRWFDEQLKEPVHNEEETEVWT